MGVKRTGDYAAQRKCLRCTTVFWSECKGNRICGDCKKVTNNGGGEGGMQVYSDMGEPIV